MIDKKKLNSKDKSIRTLKSHAMQLEAEGQKHFSKDLLKIVDYLESLPIQPQADWISCEERLPIGEEYRKRIDGIWYYQHMLTATNDSDLPMQVGWYNQEDECWYDQDGFVFYPIAWQPLPTPYKKEGAE